MCKPTPSKLDKDAYCFYWHYANSSRCKISLSGMVTNTKIKRYGHGTVFVRWSNNFIRRNETVLLHFFSCNPITTILLMKKFSYRVNLQCYLYTHKLNFSIGCVLFGQLLEAIVFLQRSKISHRVCSSIFYSIKFYWYPLCDYFTHATALTIPKWGCTTFSTGLSRNSEWERDKREKDKIGIL